MKLAGYVAWIFLCKHCDFGEKNRRYGIFLRKCFYWCDL